jgi:hypothetical protein
VHWGKRAIDGEVRSPTLVDARLTTALADVMVTLPAFVGFERRP